MPSSKTFASTVERGVARRRFVAGAIDLALPLGGVFAQDAAPEIKGVKHGCIALTDAAPLIVSKENDISVVGEYSDLKIGMEASPLNAAFEQKAAGKEIKAAMTFRGGTHDPWLRDTDDALWYLGLIRSGADISAIRSDLIFGEHFAESASREAA